MSKTVAIFLAAEERPTLLRSACLRARGAAHTSSGPQLLSAALGGLLCLSCVYASSSDAERRLPCDLAAPNRARKCRSQGATAQERGGQTRPAWRAQRNPRDLGLCTGAQPLPGHNEQPLKAPTVQSAPGIDAPVACWGRENSSATLLRSWGARARLTKILGQRGAVSRVYNLSG